MITDPVTKTFLENNSRYLSKRMSSIAGRLFIMLSPRLRKMYSDYSDEEQTELKARACANLLDAIEENAVWRAKLLTMYARKAIRVFRYQVNNVTDYKKKCDHLHIDTE